jgi:putative ABC transport system permease protein
VITFKETVSLAWSNVKSNRLRSGLTLGIIALGITALVGILTALDSIVYSLNNSLSGLGANSFTIEPASNFGRAARRGMAQKRTDQISYRQAVSFKEKYQFRGKVSVSLSPSNLVTLKYSDKKTNPDIPIAGIDDNFLEVGNKTISTGRNFSNSDQLSGDQKCIIGNDLVSLLFKGKEEFAIGKTITVSNRPYTVIGILSSTGNSMGKSADKIVYVPLLNARKLYDSDNLSYTLTVATEDAAYLDEAVSISTGLFRKIRNLPPKKANDFEIFKSDSLIGIIKDNTVQIRLATIGIGLITLLGAAIGLMNIMLVSVTERTREIGIAKSIGATSKQILHQFLSEATIICILGGLLGIILGILLGNIVTPILGGTFLIPWAWMGLGIFLCIVTGLAAGIIPAIKAAKLDPIEALRYE